MAEQTESVGEVMLKGVRLSFSDTLYDAEAGDNVPKAGKNKGKTPWRNNANFLIPKETAEGKAMHAACMKAMKAAKLAQFKDQADSIKIKGDRLALRDGDEEEWAGYPDHFYVSASRTTYGNKDGAPKRPFRVIGPRKVKNEDTGKMEFPEVKEGSSGAPYAGCYVNAIVRFWAQDSEEFGKRINCSIEAVQFARDGEAFGGGKKVNVNDAFDDMEGDDMDEPSTGKTSIDDDDDLGI